MTTEPKAKGVEAVALLARIRELLFRADPGCLGDGITATGQPYPIRDEVMDAITRTLATTTTTSAVEALARAASRAEVSFNTVGGCYERNPGNFMVAMKALDDDVKPLRELLRSPEIAALLKEKES